MSSYTFGFVMEQSLGHITYAQNLRAHVQRDPVIRALWAPVPFETSGLAARLPVYKSNWTVRAGLRARRALAQLARGQRLDALFFHTQVPAVLAADWLRRVPGVVSLDATPIQYDALGAFYRHERGAGWLERLKWRLNRDCFAAARRLVAWSRWARDGLVRDYEVPAAKIEVIPPGVTVQDWAPPTPRGPRAGPVRLLFVGGDLERKGGLLLLEAWRRLRPMEVELHLVTRDLCPAEPGLFVYHGMAPNSAPLRALYHACDLFALPTAGDCLPMVLSEAGAAGLPAVSTSVAAIPEVVRHGETGLIVPPGDRDALEAALRLLVTQPALRLAMGERATAHIARHYDAGRNANRLLDLMKAQAEPHAATT